MAGTIQLNSTTFATESSGAITVANVDSATNRTNLGLGSIATQAANSVNIDGGAIDGTTVGATTPAVGTFTTFTSTGIDDNASSTELTIDSSGNVGVGATSLTNKLTVNSSAFGQVVDLQKSGVTYGSLIITGGYPGISVGTTAGIAINSNSVALVPATSSGESDNTHDLGRSGARWDDVYATNATIQTSDATEKRNIISSDLSLDFIKKLNPVSYSFIGRTRTHYGLIAQDIETLLSTIGKGSTDFAGFIKTPITDEEGNETGEYRYGLRYHEFISPMIKAIQEQQAQIDALTARIQTLETA